MRREAFFSGDSPYEILVRSNMLLHRQAPAAVARHVAPVVESRPADEPVRLLDLACGVPITMAEMMASFAATRFYYTGIDLNPDQVSKARSFPFPDNVVESEIIEGSAWQLDGLGGTDGAADTDEPARTFDVVFVGFNWHHGTPEELWYAARGIARLLARDGVLINHDCYRPDEHAYLRRPARARGEDSWIDLRVVAPGELAAAGPPDFGFAEYPPDAAEPEWRHDLIALLEQGYRSGGGDDAGAEVLTSHSWTRDYPVSVAEIGEVLAAAGFDTEAERYPGAAGPLVPYLALVVARPGQA